MANEETEKSKAHGKWVTSTKNSICCGDSESQCDIIQISGSWSFCLNSECDICPWLCVWGCSEHDASLSASPCCQGQRAGERHVEVLVSPSSDSVVAACSIRGHCKVDTQWDSRLCNVLWLGLWRNRSGKYILFVLNSDDFFKVFFVPLFL